MQNLKDTENKKELIKDFFTWVFDEKSITNKNISLVGEIDLSLCPNYMDSNIYYPKQFADFFETPAMKRLGRISQLGLAINSNSNLYHSRLEHSKGTYNRKLEEFLYNYQNPDWRKNIEEKDLKLYLIAELLKMAGHDIGHPPLSHAMEEQIFKYRGAHEEIGKRIMLEDSNIQKVYKSISPDLLNVMNKLYNEDILNFKQHDESNYDVDRLDYLLRDNFYLGLANDLSTQKYSSIPILTDENGKPKLNSDSSICESSDGKTFIDVYDFDVLPEIEKILQLRKNCYKDIYLSPNTHIYETCIESFINSFLESESQVGINLKNLLLKMKSGNTDTINLKDYINFDEIVLYSELLDIAELHENPNIRDLAIMIIPNIDSFLTLIYSHLNLYNSDNQYTDYDKNLLKKIKSIISSDSELFEKLSNKDFAFSNTLILPDDYPENSDIPLNIQKSKIKAYKTKEPIFIRDSSGKIFELSNHPNRTCDWANEYCELNLKFAFIPYLKFKGIPDNRINELSSQCKNAIMIKKQYEIPSNINHSLSPLKVHNKLEDKFLDL